MDIDLSKIYDSRYGNDVVFRKKMWRILCASFFQKYIPNQGSQKTVLDIAAGYCEFINHIKADKKIGVDLNPNSQTYADADVTIFQSASTRMDFIQDASVDVAFTSNFFEHISKKEIQETIREVYRVLKKGGKFLILQPNFKYCYREYYMFFDHITPLDHHSMAEVLTINRFVIQERVPKFLPYTVVESRLPKWSFLIKLYLKMPLIKSLFGKQMFICALKP